jgi:hypothetical protein
MPAARDTLSRPILNRPNLRLQLGHLHLQPRDVSGIVRLFLGPCQLLLQCAELLAGDLKLLLLLLVEADGRPSSVPVQHL